MPLNYHVFENIMKNGAFAHFEQMLIFFHYYNNFKSIQNLT